MIQNNQSLHRRALYTGLHPFLAKNEIMDALLLWENQYAKNSRFALRYFVADITEKLNRPSDSKKILRSLVASLTKTDSDLLPDPIEALDIYRQNKMYPKSLNDIKPEIEAFKLLIQKWLTLTESIIARDIEHYVCSNLDRIDIDPIFSSEVQLWVKNPDHKFSHYNSDIKDLRKVINLFYIAICEYLGPTTADHLLHNSVKMLSSNGGAQYRDLFAKLL